MTSEWGTPKMVENGIIPEMLLGNKYGHKIHFFDLHKRKHVQEIDNRRRASDGARAAPGPRSDQVPRLHGRGGQHRQSRGLDLDLVSGR